MVRDEIQINSNLGVSEFVLHDTIFSWGWRSNKYHEHPINKFFMQQFSGGAIQKYVNGRGYKVIPAFTGHGIGDYFHGPPDIYPCR